MTVPKIAVPGVSAIVLLTMGTYVALEVGLLALLAAFVVVAATSVLFWRRFVNREWNQCFLLCCGEAITAGAAGFIAHVIDRGIVAGLDSLYKL